MTFGARTETLFRLLAHGKKLRGTWLDIFSYSAERKMERQLIAEYRQAIVPMLEKLTERNIATALELAQLPEMIRGFGHVKQANGIGRASCRESRCRYG